MSTRKTISVLFLLLVGSVYASAQEHIKAGFGVTVVQKQPQFPGGEDSLVAFLKSNLRYPEEARLAWIQGRVFIGFMVDHNGKIRDVKVVSGVNPQLDDEAIRVVHLMPDWVPGTIGDTRIDVQYILPIEFRMPEKKK